MCRWKRQRMCCARSTIADEYSASGDIQTCFRLFEEYLNADPLWGWDGLSISVS